MLLRLDNAVFTDETRHLGDRIAIAVLNAGLPPDSVVPFVANMLSRNETGLAQVPGVTPRVIEFGLGALSDTYVKGFQHVWATAAAFVGLSAIGKCIHWEVDLFRQLTCVSSAAAFLIDPSSEFNNHIDAPVEKEDELYYSR